MHTHSLSQSETSCLSKSFVVLLLSIPAGPDVTFGIRSTSYGVTIILCTWPTVSINYIGLGDLFIYWVLSKYVKEVGLFFQQSSRLP